MEDQTVAEMMSSFVKEAMSEAVELWDMSDDNKKRFIDKTTNYVYDMMNLTEGDSEMDVDQLLKCIDGLGVLAYHMKQSLSFLGSKDNVIQYPPKGGTH